MMKKFTELYDEIMKNNAPVECGDEENQEPETEQPKTDSETEQPETEQPKTDSETEQPETDSETEQPEIEKKVVSENRKTIRWK